MTPPLLIEPAERVPFRGAHYVHAETYDKVCAKLVEHHAENARLVHGSYETARIYAERLERLQVRLAEAEGRPAASVPWWRKLFRRARK